MPEKLKILIVDDKEPMRRLLTEVLTEAGYNVRAVSTGEKAIGEIREEDYNLVITDLKMPGMGGIEIIKEAKRINEDLSIIAITAYPTVKSAVEAIREGACEYIAKPFNIDQIKLVVHRVAERYFLLREVGRKGAYKELPVLDDITRVYNHRHFYEVLPREMERAGRYSLPFSLLMLDIDDFKKYNDANGYLAGDKLLADLANLLVSSVRGADIVFRYGGEEFAVILTHVGKEGAGVAANRMLNLIGEKLPVTVSIGMVSFPENGSSQNELIDKVISAAYQAKQSGKNRICTPEEKGEKK